MMIVFLNEEESIRPVIKRLMAHIFPSRIEGLDWQIISFQGKADLEKNFKKKMESWSYNSPHFIVTRDNDGGDCIKLKEKLSTIARETGKPFHIRIVCQELEGWLLGDLEAIERAYPTSNAIVQQSKQKYRYPDNLNNASQLLGDLTQSTGKVSRASSIAPYLTIENNRSTSFKVLVNTLRDLSN